MDSFSIIQHFFTRMSCNFCDTHFEPEGIELIRQEKGFYVVGVSCRVCARQIGVAMVGVETVGDQRQYEDPELTEAERERLADFPPIDYDDVLEAHRFLQNLDADWMRFIPPERLQTETESDTE